MHVLFDALQRQRKGSVEAEKIELREVVLTLPCAPANSIQFFSLRAVDGALMRETTNETYFLRNASEGRSSARARHSGLRSFLHSIRQQYGRLRKKKKNRRLRCVPLGS